ncbi:TRAP transporter small permease [Maritimibacter harenae]|nr:TRAP transporter small permease subunit [Maritimibacter harenae]
MVLHIFANAISRWVLGSELPGTLEITRYFYMVALIFLPLPLVTLMNRHLEADVVASMMSPRVNRMLTICANFIMAVFCAMLAWFMLLQAIDKTADGATAMIARGFMAVWPGYWPLPIALSLMSIQSLVIGFVRIARPAPTDESQNDAHKDRSK